MPVEMIFLAIGGMAAVGIVFWLVVANRKPATPDTTDIPPGTIRRDPPPPPVNPGR